MYIILSIYINCEHIYLNYKYPKQTVIELTDKMLCNVVFKLNWELILVTTICRACKAMSRFQ